MWTKGVLGDTEPRTLLNTLFFLIGKFVALRSDEEHRSLTFDQISVIKRSDKERSKLRYTFGEKNYPGGLSHRNSCFLKPWNSTIILEPRKIHCSYIWEVSKQMPKVKAWQSSIFDTLKEKSALTTKCGTQNTSWKKTPWERLLKTCEEL